MVRHIRDANRGSPYPFHAAIREHGAGSFFVEKLFKSDCEKTLNKIEALWCDIYNAYHWSTDPDPDLPPVGYNCALAGFSNKFRGKKHTDASKAKISAARRKYLADKLSTSSSDGSDTLFE